MLTYNKYDITNDHVRYNKYSYNNKYAMRLF